MHQHPRPPPVTASPANSEQTNPTRTNNPRDRTPLSGGNMSPQIPGSGSEDDFASRQDQSSPNPAVEVSRLNQVIQNFHTKAALIILHSRVDLAPAYTKGTDNRRVNKWFNLELDETEEYKDDIRRWKICDMTNDRPPPLVIEIYLCADSLASNQTLVILDEHGKKWDVMDALVSAENDDTHPHAIQAGKEVILERWTIHLGHHVDRLPTDLTSILPLVYKKSIVLFRSLFTYTKFLPAWKFLRALGKFRSLGSLNLKYRIIDGSRTENLSGLDNLTVPLYQSGDRTVSKYAFGVTDSPAGPFSVHVVYRNNCEFQVVDSEALLSSRLLREDVEMFNPSLPGISDGNDLHRVTAAQEIGSLPSARRNSIERPDLGHAYGSLSTFHRGGPATGSSPISALRNAQGLVSDELESPPRRRPAPYPRSTHISRPSLGGLEGIGRKTSIAFQPFKTPSLSASPSIGQTLLSSPRSSSGRVPVIASLNRARGVPEPTSPTHPYGPVPVENLLPSSASNSPKPAPLARYSSSFGHRRARVSSGGTGKTDEDQSSSGKESGASSAAQPGSGLLAPLGSGSTGSVHEDDDNISDFIKMLETKKDLLNPSSNAATEASTRRTAAALTRFYRMRDSNAALSDSLSSSLMLQRSSTSSSRQLSGVPAMIAATSVSTSSSPGKPISPHTPHTPAIPSRLGSNSIISYDHREPSERRHSLSIEEHHSPSEAETSEDTALGPSTGNVSAIPIPTSPRRLLPGYRRSSSAAHRRQPLDEDETANPYGNRSTSLGPGDGRPRAKIATEEQQDTLEVPVPLEEHRNGPADRASERPEISPRRSSLGHKGFATTIPPTDGPGSGSAARASPSYPLYRSRLLRGGFGRVVTPLHGSSSSFGPSSGATIERVRGSGSHSDRPSFSRPDPRYEEDEPFLFKMDLGGSRRSLEDPVPPTVGSDPASPATEKDSGRGLGLLGRGHGRGLAGGGGNYSVWS